MKNKIAIIVACLGLSGCELIPKPGGETKRYVLSPLSDGCPVVMEKNAHSQLVIEVPAIFLPIDSNRIAVKTSENQIDYYADIEWGERLSGLTQVMILYSLQNAGCFRAILRNPDGVYPDYNLKIEIRQFYVDRTLNPCRAVVEYFLQLVKSDDRQVVATETIMEQTPLETESSKEVIEKLDKTNQKAIEKLIHWISISLK